MKKDINPVEKEQEKKRSRISFLISFAVHFIILIIIIISSKMPVQEKHIVMTVKLTDKINEEMKRLPESEKKKILKKQKKAIKKKEKQLEKKKKQIEQELQKDQEKPLVDEPVNAQKDKDVFKEYEKKRIKDEKQIEESFFDEETTIEKEEELESIEDELNKLDEALNDLEIFNEDDEPTGTEQTASMNDDNIQWQNSIGRVLIYRTELIISDEFIKKGLKTSLKIRFTVFESGLIVNVEVVTSTGFPKLDQEIIEQFKKWKFKEASGEPPIYGITEINIGY